MIQFTGYDLLWLFFIYSFAGWVLETAAATFMHRKFSNRGLVNGPLCILYGVGAVAMSVGLQELTGLWLFLFASLYAAVTEFVAGKLIERFYHKRWWDYSKSKWNLDGYICLPVSLIKGALGYVVVKYANRWVFRLLAILPQLLVHIVLLVLIGVLVVDVLASYLLVTGKSRHPEKWLEANNKIDRFRIRLGNKIAGSIEKRMTKAYPKASFVEKVTKDKTVFAIILFQTFVHHFDHYCIWHQFSCMNEFLCLFTSLCSVFHCCADDIAGTDLRNMTILTDFFRLSTFSGSGRSEKYDVHNNRSPFWKLIIPGNLYSDASSFQIPAVLLYPVQRRR